MSIEELEPLIRSQVLHWLDHQPSCTDEALWETIEEEVFRQSRGLVMNSEHTAQLVGRIYHSFRGLDALQPLLDDPAITEIMINGYDELFIERRGVISRYDGRFSSPEKLEDVIQAVVAKVNRVVNASTPIVDARLPDGSRVNVVLPPVALKGPAMTIRKFPERPLVMADLVRMGAINPEAADFLRQLVLSKYNVFISGGTGSGKTTFLGALAGFIPADERIVTIEDSAELQISNIANLISLETRNANTEGRGEITIRELIRTSLRMRPDRILVGEVRGAEALDMLAAMNTGHDGSISTGHANSAADMLSRLETMVLSAAALPLHVVRKQITSALDILIHLTRMRDKSRMVTEIYEVLGVEEGEVRLQPLYLYEEIDGIGALRPTGNKMIHKRKLELAGIAAREEEH